MNDAYSSVSNPLAGFNQTSTETHHYILGASVEVRLPARFAVEGDALYRTSNYSYSYAVLNSAFNIRETARNLEFPVLLKWYALPGPVRPFVEAGPTFRHVFLSNGDASTPNTAGGTVGAGISFKLGPLKVAPEVRYTRWGSAAITAPSFVSVRNQSDFFLNFRF